MRLPWAPLNFGVFLIIFGGLMLLGLLGVGGLSPFTGFPLVFAFFGLWLAALAVAMPTPAHAYDMPRSMVLGWGALLSGIGILWFVAIVSPSLVPIALAIVLVVAGIGAVGYSYMRGLARKPVGQPGQAA